MRFPFVSRAIYEDVKVERDRLLDKLMQQSFGFQLHDSFTEKGEQSSATVAGPEPEPAQDTEEELQARENAELISRARTKRSTLPGLMEQIMTNRLIRRAKAAVVQPTRKEEIAARFEKIKAETLKSIQ